jgi:hypothetical protein
MSAEQYEEPTVTILGVVSDLTRSKPGIYFDFPGSNEGNKFTPPRDPGGIVS